MRMLRKMVWSMVFGFIVFALLWSMSDAVSPGMKSVAALPKYIALVQKRKVDPLASKEDLQKVMAETPEGLEGLHKALKSEGTSAPRFPAELDAEAAPVATSPATAPALEAKPSKNDTTIVASSSEPATVLVNGRNFVDPNAIEKIERMNILQSMKDEIIATYKRSGILPSFQETRAPAAVSDSGTSQSR